MNLQEEVSAECPYCGEIITLLVDCSESKQQYIEDCEVCCRPMNVSVIIDHEGWPQVQLSHEND
ncbi:CPXCG motif-containing cysteine-rich protein [Pontibacterium sp. N1Y112]|uniref:CPXCG motif-containing cysteine-rich protein n=1 Tax=Pontibacterium sinense TaxID=2781979 RepID=A0A8J7FRV2_9GAMM|nr:CPXCG motif-containing cysteine-rich protein [Pontibacterium sinense]MBE9396240.1 CPXCG motif-containing cysteine-rich protein [Pontibacterium sinense]